MTKQQYTQKILADQNFAAIYPSIEYRIVSKISIAVIMCWWMKGYMVEAVFTSEQIPYRRLITTWYAQYAGLLY